jgi:hypothetical protein
LSSSRHRDTLLLTRTPDPLSNKQPRGFINSLHPSDGLEKRFPKLQFGVFKSRRTIYRSRILRPVLPTTTSSTRPRTTCHATLTWGLWKNPTRSEQTLFWPSAPATHIHIHSQDPPRTLHIKMHFESSPGSSPSKSIPISISPNRMASPTSSLYSNYALECNSSRGSSCAYPSWPSGSSLGYRNTPSSFISDADLFGEDEQDSSPYLTEAPAPPRQPPMAQAFPILPPLYAPKKSKSERRRSSDKQRRASKPMTPISESPEQVE